MKRQLVLAAILVMILSSFGAVATEYNYVVIATAHEDLPAQLHRVQSASINDLGQVTFSCSTSRSVGGYCLGDESGFDFLLDNSGPLASFGNFSSSTPGPFPYHLAFFGSPDAGGLGIFLYSEGNIRPIAVNTAVDPNSPFLGLVGTSMNDRRQSAFLGIMAEGQGVFRYRNGRLKLLATNGGSIDGFTGNFSLNNRGEVAFFAVLTDGEAALMTVKGQRLRVLADTRGFLDDFPSATSSINDRGEVLFMANPDGGGRGLFIADRKSIRPIVFDTQALPTSRFITLQPTMYSLNNAGQVVFGAKTVEGVEGIFNGPNPDTDLVMSTRDPLFESEAQFKGKVEMLNKLGQVAFSAGLTGENKSYIIRADPVSVEQPRVKQSRR